MPCQVLKNVAIKVKKALNTHGLGSSILSDLGRTEWRITHHPGGGLSFLNSQALILQEVGVLVGDVIRLYKFIRGYSIGPLRVNEDRDST